MESLINRIIESEEFKDLTNIGLNYLDIALKIQIVAEVVVGVIIIIFFVALIVAIFKK